MDLREYKVGDLTYLLDEADAARLGGVPVEVSTKEAPAPANKARRARTKRGDGGDAAPDA